MCHKIYLADNRHILRIPDNSIELTVTSPPYVTTEFKKGQEFDYEKFLSGFQRLCIELFRVTVPGGRFALNVADIITKYRYTDSPTISRVPLGSDTFQCAQSAGFRLLERFIWDKGFTRNFGGPLLGSYPYPPTLFNNNYFEYVYVLQKPGKRKVNQERRQASRLTVDEWRDWTQKWWRIESISEKFGFHGAVFPIELPYRLIRMYSYFGDTVLDPYMGTGATAIAANKCGRNSIGFEISDRCEDWVAKRLEFDLAPLIDQMPEIEFCRISNDEC